MRALLFPFHSACRTFALVACVLFLQGCSAVKLAYNQAPQLVYWRLNNYFNLTEAQADRLRSELGDLHQWHRDQMLPQHAALLSRCSSGWPMTSPLTKLAVNMPTCACRSTSSSRRWSLGLWCSHRS